MMETKINNHGNKDVILFHSIGAQGRLVKIFFQGAC